MPLFLEYTRGERITHFNIFVISPVHWAKESNQISKNQAWTWLADLLFIFTIHTAWMFGFQPMCYDWAPYSTIVWELGNLEKAMHKRKRKISNRKPQCTSESDNFLVCSPNTWIHCSYLKSIAEFLYNCKLYYFVGKCFACKI